MFQFIRRVSASFLPRPDRPWRDDATSHAPTIGRKRRYSVTEQDRDEYASASKRSKNDPIEPDTGCDSPNSESAVEAPASPVDGQDVKEVTKGVKEVDLEDKDKVEVEVASSIRPEGVPLPDSPSGSPEPEPESREPEPESREPEPAPSCEVEQTKDQEHADDIDSVASSGPEDDTEEVEPITTTTDASPDKTAMSAQQVTIVVHSGLHEAPEVLEVKA